MNSLHISGKILWERLSLWIDSRFYVASTKSYGNTKEQQDMPQLQPMARLCWAE
jgi:hypothetical protein